MHDFVVEHCLVKPLNLFLYESKDAYQPQSYKALSKTHDHN